MQQARRVGILLGELGILILISYLAFGSVLPPTGTDGFWYYAALLNLLLGNRLVTPFYSTPADSIAYAVTALMTLLVANQWPDWGETERALFAGSASILGLVVLVGLIQIFLKDSIRKPAHAAAESARIFLAYFGTSKFIFSVLIIFALFSFHRETGYEAIWISIAWLALIASSPIEHLAGFLGRLRKHAQAASGNELVGSIAAYETPGAILIRETGGVDLQPGQLVACRDPHSSIRYAKILDYAGRYEGDLVRALEIRGETSTRLEIPPDHVVRLGDSELSPNDAYSRDLLDRWRSLVGIVSPDTNTTRLNFEVTGAPELQEGKLVETLVGGSLVLYQVVEGVTKEEIIYQKNTRGFARAQAQKIGIWDPSAEAFTKASWLPSVNSPVFLREEVSPDLPQLATNAIGRFPGTGYPIRISSIDDLVAHNAAILGVLGIGKSMLSIELVERMMADGVKVICLDLTDQYAHELAEYYDEQGHASSTENLRSAGEKDRDAHSDNPEKGGSWENLREAIYQDLAGFLSPENPRPLKIYNPSAISGTRQFQEPKTYRNEAGWQRSAGLWSVTPVEVTQLVSEEVLHLVQAFSSPRVCLVYEEAHSLIPEWNAVATDRDRSATNATSRAILQGRKYGMGCLVITQRTASVTKTILNQCNTVFSMRMFDETGKDFLSNFVGKDYAQMLPELQERHAVIFGKASSCANPVLARLNDRDDFLEGFRAASPPPDKSGWTDSFPVSEDGPGQSGDASGDGAGGGNDPGSGASHAEDPEDDIPF